MLTAERGSPILFLVVVPIVVGRRTYIHTHARLEEQPSPSYLLRQRALLHRTPTYLWNSPDSAGR